jgi:hypothetical protein
MFSPQINRIGKNSGDRVKDFHNVELKMFWGLGWASLREIERGELWL